MNITSASICAAADQLQGYVGFNTKAGRYIVRFSEDAFGLDTAAHSITPTCEFVWRAFDGELMRLDRARLQLLLEQNIGECLNISEPLRVYAGRQDLPEITAERHRLNA